MYVSQYDYTAKTFVSAKKQGFVGMYLFISNYTFIHSKCTSWIVSSYFSVQYNVCSDTNSWAFHNADPAVSAIGTECTVDYVEILGIAYTCESTQLNTRLCGPVFHIYKGATVANGNAMSLCGMNFLPKMPNRVSFLMFNLISYSSIFRLHKTFYRSVCDKCGQYCFVACSHCNPSSKR